VAAAYPAASRLLKPGPESPSTVLAREDVRTRHLCHASAACLARLRFKEGLALALAEGRMSLAEAIAEVRDYHDEEEPGPEHRWYGRGNLRHTPGESEEERCGRNLIQLAAVKLGDSPGPARQAVARLERELREYLAGRAAARPAPRP
jgi:hypothetical protein